MFRRLFRFRLKIFKKMDICEFEWDGHCECDQCKIAKESKDEMANFKNEELDQKILDILLEQDTIRQKRKSLQTESLFLKEQLVKK